MTITILTNDTRWKGLGPTVKRAAEAVLVELKQGGLLASSPLGGEPNRSYDLVGGTKKQTRGAKKLAAVKTPHQLPSGIWLPPKGGASEQASRFSITILLTNDAEIRTLNKNYRRKDKPTNVLSFPDGMVVDGVKQLGDVVLAYETIAREAAEQGKTLKEHLTHLTIHGVLHLLGYDHESENDAEVMETLEITILSSMGIANPYEAD